MLNLKCKKGQKSTTNLFLAIATPVNSSAMSQSSSDSTPSSRPAYPRTQYSMPRAHVSLDSTGPHSQMGEGMYSSHALHNPYENNASTSYTR